MHRLFPSQLETETIYLVVREHAVLLILKLFVWLIFAAALPLFKNFVSQNIPGLLDGDYGTVTTMFIQLYSLFLVVALFTIWLMHYLNVQIITDIRVVDIYQTGLFSHTVSELHIDKIEDVTSETDGILGTLFDFGFVFIQTAGTIDRFKFTNVPHPSKIEKTLLDLYEKNSNFVKEG